MGEKNERHASHEITFGEEEIADVSLATFYVFDKENPRTFSPGVRLAGHGGGGGLTEMDSKIANVDANIERRGEAVEQRFTQTDNRLAQTIKRFDLGRDQQADVSSKINKIDADLTSIHKRIDLLDQPKARPSNLPH